MRPEHHIASSDPEYTTEEVEFLKGLKAHEERTGRMLTFVEVYRYLNSRNMIRDIDDGPVEMLRLPGSTPQICMDEDDDADWLV